MARDFVKHFAAAIAALSAAATLLTALFKFDCLKENWFYGVVGAVVVIAVSIMYAWWQTKSKKSITLDLASELKLNISEGDLFEKKGVICIPVNEYFDTHVGDGVVDGESIHGQFINKYFKDRIEDLEAKLRSKLPHNDNADHERRIQGCPTKRYPLGTCVDIREGENTYVLFALTNFDDNDKANVGRLDYTVVVCKLMEHLNTMVEGRPVYMPLFGTRLSRMRRTAQRILLHLVDSLDFNDSCTIPGGVNIVIKSLDKLNVNLTTLEYVVKHGISNTDQESAV